MLLFGPYLPQKNFPSVLRANKWVIDLSMSLCVVSFATMSDSASDATYLSENASETVLSVWSSELSAQAEEAEAENEDSTEGENFYVTVA